MQLEREPRNLVRYARSHMLIDENVNRQILRAKDKAHSEQAVDKAIAWTSSYSLLFAALAVFMPYETALAVERTIDFADKVGGVLGLTDGWGIYIRGTMD